MNASDSTVHTAGGGGGGKEKLQTVNSASKDTYNKIWLSKILQLW
jgi:hypothetical protein